MEIEKKKEQRNSYSESSSPSPSSSPSHSSNRSRSRDKEIEEENHIEKNQVKTHSDTVIEGKLYLANIPISIPQGKIIEEFSKYGKIIDFSFRKKTDIPNAYYFGYITLSGKEEAKNAMENITQNLNWTVKPFGKEIEVKHLNKNININSFLNKKINNQEEHLSSNSKNIILNNKLNLNLTNIINVREIRITNLPLSTNESGLYKEFFVYGEISKIELKTFWDKKNAFIKYRLVQSAIKAFNVENNAYFNGNIINVTFSNESQRKDIKGNESGFELNENNCKLIVVCLNKNLETADEETFLNIFENYGKIKNIKIKNISNRNHIFIEYYKYEEAQRAIIEMNKEINYEKRKMLRDEKCEIDFYFKNKYNEINPFSKQQNINMNNEQFPNMKNSNNLNIPFLGGQANIFQMLQKNLMNQFNSNLLNNFQRLNQININQYKNINNNNNCPGNNYNNRNLTNNQLNNCNLTNQYLNIIKKNSNKSLLTSKNVFPCQNPLYFQNLNRFIFPQNCQNLQNRNQQNLLLLNNPIFSNVINNNFKNQINYNNNNFAANTNKNSTKVKNTNESNNSYDVKDLLNKIISDKSKKKQNSNSDSDISSINSSKSIEETDFEKEFSLEEENLKYIWNGYLTKNNKEKVNIDIYKIRGKIDDNYFTGYHFNICNRIHYEEVLKKYLLGIVAISPNNIAQKEIFEKYINYFRERQRCGVINISENYILYIASPGEFSKKFYINPKKHLLGLLVDSKVEPKLYVNNLALPPPVISTTEKRRLMSLKRKNENKKEIKKNNHSDKENGNEEVIMKLKEQLQNNDN